MSYCDMSNWKQKICCPIQGAALYYLSWVTGSRISYIGQRVKIGQINKIMMNEDGIKVSILVLTFSLILLELITSYILNRKD